MPRPPARIPRPLRDRGCRVRRGAPPFRSSTDLPAATMTRVAADPVLLLVAGPVIDALFGDMPAIFCSVPHPVAAGGRALFFCGRKRTRKPPREADRRERGIVTVVVLVGGAALLGLV